MLKLKVIKWIEFCEGIADHWQSTDPQSIPIYNNPYGIIDIPTERIAHDMIYFPCAFYENDELVGYISIYNLNHVWVRPRGIYILPEHRGGGLGYEMMRKAIDLFPPCWRRAFIICNKDNANRFLSKGGMTKCPVEEPMISGFSNEEHFLLYLDRQYKEESISKQQQFVLDCHKEFGLGGTNNLNVDWDYERWSEYYDHHKGNYSVVKNIRLCMALKEEKIY